VIDPQAITDAVWAARGPSLWTRKPGDDEPRKVQPDDEDQKTKKPRTQKRMTVDAEGMAALRRQGYEWRAIAMKFDVSLNTCRNRVAEIAPDLFNAGMRGVASPKPASQMVIRNQGDADKTGRIQGTGVSA